MTHSGTGLYSGYWRWKCLPAREGGAFLVKIKLVAPLVLVLGLGLMALLLPRLVARIQAAIDACKSG